MPEASDRSPSEMHWRSLAGLNLFRLLCVVGLIISIVLFSRRLVLDPELRQPFVWLISGDLILIALFAITIRKRIPNFEIQLSAQVVTDVIFLVSLMDLFGGVKSGLGILLLPYLAAAGLISRGRMTLFHAAVASIALLIEQGWRVLNYQSSFDENFTPALLCIACFAVAWLGHRLSRLAEASEKLAEQRGVDLQNLAQVNQRILQDVSDGVVVVDGAGHIRQFNERAELLTGQRLQIGERLAASLPLLGKAVTGWQADRQRPLELVAGVSPQNTLRLRMVGLSAAEPGDVMVYLEDMDRLRQESQQLKLAALGRLTANLAHEIRNPLSAISHAAQLLGEETHSDPLYTRLTRIIDDNANRLERMVRDVLELNRRDRLQMTEIDLANWLQGFLLEFRQVENIVPQLTLSCPANAVIRFDPGHLHQVLWNLARNGWRYCSQGENSLTFTVELLDGRWQLDVFNDGPPVPADAQVQLFEPFFTTESKGTGLGLYIAREICAANAAQLEYAPPPDGGARFRITFGMNDGQKNTNG
ncbi:MULTISPECIES: sensor histidine kinase [Silvimonas]|uniref:sensor histidine kinase n=1 Tax=Silvimonas TaxID=300264 RepID=UPI0024B3658A|nr:MULTISPECIES: HAMP domain-containing sensor histidine kinase [Silvimonas]MDR3427580.1 HAMP domain-containing sensor histidine kinase [Silvimonas sp.]